MPHFLGPTELIIVLVIILVLFGVGRISKIAGEMGRGIHEFRKGMSANESETPAEKTES
jgi:sec-independent protein translocase protein TatA